MGTFAGPKDWGRLLTAMITPFDTEGNLNRSELAKVAAYLVDEQRNDGLVVCGTTGESPTLTSSEKLEVLKIVLDAVGNRAAVILGAGTYNTAESIELAKEGEKAGAHGIMLVNPYYSKPGQRGLEAHFKAIASGVGLPVMLYNIQPRSAINLETETLMRLAEVPNIVAVKEASGNIGQISDVCRMAPPGFRVYSGDDALTLPILSLGGYGLVSVAAHLVGKELSKLITIFPEDPLAATSIHHRLTSFIKAIFASPSPTPIKYAMSQVGFNCEEVRLPLVTLSPDEKRAVDLELSKLGASAGFAVAKT